MSEDAPVAVIGAGPAGLIAADVLSAAGQRVVVIERMPSLARKFLMAGRGGLNLTHSEEFAPFVTRYREAAPRLQPLIKAFTPQDLIAWVEGLGQDIFIGSSGRVFPKAMKASPLLRALLRRLSDRGVAYHTNTTWRGWDESGALRFDGPVQSLKPRATLLALGGASWPKLGSNGAWVETLAARGVEIAPLQPTNVGFNVAWSDYMRGRFAGQPLKTIAIRHGEREIHGEAMITRYGIEGGAIYALSADLRRHLPTEIAIDLRPALSADAIAAKLVRAKARNTLSTTLRKTIGLPPVAIGLIYENGAPPRAPAELAALIKSIPIRLHSAQGLERAISSAGGVKWSAVDETLQLRAMADVYVAGEMLDWEAPTGGYLLQASFATGVHAAQAILQRCGGT